MLMPHRAVRAALLPLLTLLLAGFVSVGTAPSAPGRGRLPLLGLLHRHGRRLRRPGDRARRRHARGRRHRGLPLRRPGELQEAEPAPGRPGRGHLRRGLRRQERRRPARSGWPCSSTTASRPTPPTARPRRSPRPCARSWPRRPTASRPSSPSHPTSARRSRRSARCVCGISGYPATGCADVKAPQGSPADGPAVEFAGPRRRRGRVRRVVRLGHLRRVGLGLRRLQHAAAGRPRGPRGRDRGRRPGAPAPQRLELTGRTTVRPHHLITHPRALHPGAWWLWALGLAAAASRTLNPVPLVLIIAVTLVRGQRPPWRHALGGVVRPVLQAGDGRDRDPPRLPGALLRPCPGR